ncbi:MAG: type II secretion system GspH family protein [Lachnospiraceae bacterium]|nr:type II secretion system GspH family protein [Lachnospiraceae bacterium]
MTEMRTENNNKGISLMELIIVIAIMAVLVGIISPMMVKYVSKAKQVRVEKEATEFIKAAKVAYIDVCEQGKEPQSDTIKHKASKSSPYYKNGTLYGNYTNWTVHNGVVAGASNVAFGEAIFKTLGITIGKGWTNGGSSIPISKNQPKVNPAGSMTEECIFQIFYTKSGDMVVEYSRNGYFVRVENSVLVDSIKIERATDKLFTIWQ